MGDTIIIKIVHGSIRGKKVTGHNGVNYYSFQGIPYAKPPVGQLRFKAPQEPESWKGVRDTLTLGPVCPQIDAHDEGLNTDEDCLFLNVYTPEISPTLLLPVMVYFHGGALQFGSGNTHIHGADYLMPHQVILVTLNFRLGVLGFLDVRGTDATPNNGIRDQLFALKWVRSNIEKFGGDPENVTVFGVSAGALCAHCQMFSSLSKGLFQKGILMSGSMFGALAPFEHNPEKAQNFARNLGFNGSDPQHLVDYLRTRPVSDLLLPLSVVGDKTLYMGVVIEEETAEAVLPETPLLLTRNGQFNRIPLMVGITYAEGKLAYLLGKIDFANYNDNLESFLPSELGLANKSQKSEEIVNKIKKFYFNDKIISEKELDQFINLHGDLRINYGIHRLVKEYSNVSDMPLYYYQFSYEGKYNLTGKDIPGKGAGHGDDLFYLFHSDVKNNNYIPGTSEHKVSCNVTKLWTNFAKTGNPNTGLDVHWPPVSKTQKPFLKIDTDLTVHKDLNKERMEFWDQIYNECGIY